jgi:DNA-binding protein YbaB
MGIIYPSTGGWAHWGGECGSLKAFERGGIWTHDSGERVRVRAGQDEGICRCHQKGATGARGRHPDATGIGQHGNRREAAEGAVKVVLSGNQEPRRVEIAPAALEKGAGELSELVFTALKAAYDESTATMKKKMDDLTGGLGLPGV